jgi:hypothetical protein
MLTAYHNRNRGLRSRGPPEEVTCEHWWMQRSGAGVVEEPQASRGYSSAKACTEEQLRGERGLGRKLWRPRQHHCMPEPVGPAVVLISVLWAMRRGMVGFKSLKEKKWWP